MKKYSFVLFVALIFISCHNKISNNLETYLEEHSNERTIGFKFTEITDFEWDVMYFFGASGPFDIIFEITGRDYSRRLPRPRLIFMNNGELVYEEELSNATLEKENIYFYFDTSNPNMLSSYAFTPNQSFTIIPQGEKTYCFILEMEE